jgi:hypothetical protein
MTQRERVLLILFVTLVLGGGGIFGAVYYFRVSDGYSKRIIAARSDIQAKETEIAREQKDMQRIQELDQRLKLWQQYSLPDTKERDSELVQRHVSNERIKYERRLSEILTKNGFTSVSTVSKAFETQSGTPQAGNKTPPTYTRLEFKIEGQATFQSVVYALEAFYKEESLHQVRNFVLKKPAVVGPQPADGAAAQPGMGPNAQAGQDGQRGPVPMGPRPGGRGGQQQRGRDVLDVSMVVEVLIVTGAETRQARDERWAREGKTVAMADRNPRRGPPGADPRKPGAEDKKPDDKKPAEGVPFDDGFPEEEQEDAPKDGDKALTSNKPPIIVLAPGRHYDDMLYKNMYTGMSKDRARSGTVTEDPRAVLSCIKLVMLDNYKDRRWIAEFFDQARKDTYYRVSPDYSSMSTLSIKDKYWKSEEDTKNVVMTAKIVDAHLYGAVLEYEGKFYKIYLGEFLSDVFVVGEDGKLKAHPDRPALSKYERGDWKSIFDLPKKDDEKKPDEKKTDDKKPDAKKPDDKKTDDKKPMELKRLDLKEPESKPEATQDAKKTEAKKTDDNEPDKKKPELRRLDLKEPEAKPEATKDGKTEKEE